MNINALNRFVKIADRLVIRSPTLTILGHICIENGKMRVTDLENTLIVPVENQRSYTIPFISLKAVLKQKPENLSIKPGKAGKVTLTYANKSLIVQGMKTEDFPEVPKIKFKKIDEWDGERISTLLSQLPFTSKETLRPALTGIFLEYDDEIKSVATDGHLMRVITYSNGNGVKEKKILSGKALKIISAPPLKPVEVFSTESHALFKRKDGIKLYSRWIDEKYPDYEDFVEDINLKGNAKFDVKELLSAISDLKPFVNKVTQGLRLKLGSGKLCIISDDPDNKTSFRAEVPASTNFNGRSFEAGFNASFLETALKSIGTENVVWTFNTPNDKTFWLDDVKDPDVINLLMPIRIGE